MSINEMPRYIPSMVENLHRLHSIKSQKSGLLTDPQTKNTWKEMMLSIFNGESINWNEVANRDSLDKDLIIKSVAKVMNKIENTEFNDKDYSLLHTDFNQRNLFVDPNGEQITGIIDWEDAMFGDPIYDFARIRMLIWHFDLGEETIKKYYDLINYTPKQKKLEDLYWLSRVIQYLAWYSEELTEFNLGRIKLHQDYLRIQLT
jgi:aminoglycoside phosphotransferase (APT) family kinase protein